jgi:hypothetical protein
MRPCFLGLAALVAVGGCGDDDGSAADAGMAGADAAPDGGATMARAWSAVLEDLPSALLSIDVRAGWGYAVGADDGEGPMVLRQAGPDWERVPTGATGALWWVAPDGDALLMSGEGGLLLAHAPGTSTFDVIPPLTDKTLFGVWVAPDGTAWSVGGDVLADTDRGAILVRRDGTWQVDDSVPPALYTDVALFKVWGLAADDVWIVGERGRVLRFDGSDWRTVESGTTSRLLTAHGTADDGPYLVGGASNGVILEWTGTELVDRAPEFLPAYNGVRATGGGHAFAVGNNGVLSERIDGTWIVEEAPPTALDLHAVTVDPNGDAWAVGGALSSPALDRGVLLRYGSAP